ncbi:type III-A CRISPR-associated protein Cas10/Csm1 [Dissulfurispira thermophila]|uniref:CRISPR system single-strand-specific deoxyribonuclease Cas10/Csm1 (subtype III-A) n=2 Tax=root TaxID=1 RepID=A0A7G1H1E4_9BACT|nr:type III-A CRISPR-associated protein Cas10/Csm1 [Dissulfurispira thermophila]BCB96604.1 type III-A CRISPR-associated protein Cas10/Csm1 [Dissulfurispira thermophila]
MENFNSIVKGALIHDIGKLIQRAQPNPSDKKHGQWGYDWLQESKFFEEDALSIRATITHHKDDEDVFTSNYGLIWYESDNLASFERKQEEDNEKGRWDMFTPLASPFFKVRNPNNLTEYAEISYLPVKKSEGVESVSFNKPDITSKDYESIIKGLKNDLELARGYRPYSINLLLMLFEKHLSNVPSITREVMRGREEQLQKHPDISLFNHSKLTAAIAGSMYHFYRETYPDKWNNELLKDEILKPSPDQKPYLLIGGDISGVQRFIYTISSKGALRSLKGRSFYLELLSEHVVSELIEALQLTRCNIIFLGGGHFYILSYNTKSALEAIDKVRKKINDFLFDEFKGSFQLHIDYVPFSKEGLKNAVPVWQGLSRKLEALKKKKWEDRLFDVLKVECQHRDCDTTYCAVCFREDLPLKDLKMVDDIIKLCEPCYNQYALGTELIKVSKSNHPVIYKLPDKPEGDSIKIGDWYYQIKYGWDKDLHKEAKAVYRINDLNAKHYSHDNTIYIPTGIYQHEDLKELSDAFNVYGMNRIAVLRMDVDNLGKIFAEAVPEEDRTFSRMASISKGLNQFFKYHLNDIVEGKDIDSYDIVGRDMKQTGRRLSVVYSGGDDLFIIGHWLDVLEASYDIKRYFEKYTGNSFITISGGIAINHENYPVYQFARDAQESEERAKSGGKNAIGIFTDESLKWVIFEKVIERIRLFKNFLKVEKDHLSIKGNSLPKTFFYRLLALARRFRNDKVLVLPKAAYLISRAKGKPEDILKIKEVIMTSNEQEWKVTEIATLITLMLMRKGGRENA